MSEVGGGGKRITQVENQGMDGPWPILRAPMTVVCDTTSKSRTPVKIDWL
jgi:hypothetical protein